MIAALRLAAMAAALILLLPLHYLWLAAGRASPWPRRFLAFASRAAGLRVRIEGEPRRHDVLFVANHIGWLDIPLIAGATGAAFVAKDEIDKWALIGWLARLNRTIFVAQRLRTAARDQADMLREALADGRCVALFPEGTTVGGESVLPFRPSLLASVFPPLPKLLVQPVAIDFGAAGPVFAWVGDEGAVENAMKVLGRRRPTDVRLAFLTPIDPHQAGDRKGLAERCRTEILAALSAQRPIPYMAPQ